MHRLQHISIRSALSLLLAGALLFSFSSCGGSDADTDGISSTAESVTSETFDQAKATSSEERTSAPDENSSADITSRSDAAFSTAASSAGGRTSSKRPNAASGTAAGSRDNTTTASRPAVTTSTENTTTSRPSVISSVENNTTSNPVITSSTEVATSQPDTTTSTDDKESEDVTSDITVNPQEDFVLTIAVEDTTIRQGENFTVNVEMKNNSQADCEISYSFLFWPRIPGWYWQPFGDVAIDPPFFQRNFEANSVLRNIHPLSGEDQGPFLFGEDLEPGTYELKFSASFWLNWQQDNQQEFRILSNPVMITVQ